MIQKSDIEWKLTRKNGLVSTGTQRVGGKEVEWFINKSPGGLCYGLHLGKVCPVPLATRATIIECKQYAGDFF